MTFKAEIIGIVKQATYSGPGGYSVTAEGRWEGYETEKNITLTLAIPVDKVRSFQVGDGVEVRLLNAGS